jgi:4-hydroxybenzoate polyprenyltransferase
VRLLALALAVNAATFLAPFDRAAPLLAIGSVAAVVVYAGLSRGGGRRRVKDILIVKNAVVSAGLVGLAISLVLLAAPRERGLAAIVEAAREHWAALAVVTTHLLIRVFADAVLCDLDDEESDRAHGTDTIPTRLRRPKAWWVAGTLRILSAMMLLAWTGGPTAARVAWAAAICAGTAGLAAWNPRRVRDLVDARFAVEAGLVAVILACS